MLAIPAPYHVNLHKAAAALDAEPGSPRRGGRVR